MRRSSTDGGARAPDARRTIYDSLNERRLTRERIIASLLMCPSASTSGKRNGVGAPDG